MGINFPNAPSIGQVYPLDAVANFPQYVWDGTAWVLKSGGMGPTIYVSDTAPPTAIDGALWWCSADGILYLRYNDGVGAAQWVQAAPSAADYASLVQYADTLAYSGMQFNGSMDISQELGAGNISVSGYACDGWQSFVNGTMVVTAGKGSGGPPGIPGILYLQCGTAQASVTGGDYSVAEHAIEGNRVGRLRWGTVYAQPITIGFWTSHTKAGVYSLSIRGSLGTPSYSTTYTQAVSNVWQYNVVTIPGCTIGTWPADNTLGMRVTLAAAVGTGNIAPVANVWSANNYLGAPGQVNAMDSTANACRFTGLVVLPGLAAPTADRSPFIMRSADVELTQCMRYWERGLPLMNYRNTGTGTVTGISSAYDLMRMAVPKRIAPAVSFFSWQYYNTGDGFINVTPTTSGVDTTSFIFATTAAVNFKAWTSNQGYWVANARF